MLGNLTATFVLVTPEDVVVTKLISFDIEELISQVLMRLGNGPRPFSVITPPLYKSAVLPSHMSAAGAGGNGGLQVRVCFLSCFEYEKDFLQLLH